MWKLAVRVVALLALFVLAGAAQVNPNLDQGLKPWGSYAGGNIDSVSLETENLFVRSILWSISQRGAVTHSLAFSYNSGNWQVEGNCNPYSGCNYHWAPAPNTSLGVGIGDPEGLSEQQWYSNVESWGGAYRTWYAVQTADGATHTVADTSQGWESIDGTGIGLIDNNSAITLMDRTGVRYPQSGSIIKEDPNGNQITQNSSGQIVDTVGRTWPIYTSTTDYTGCTGPWPTASANLAQVPAPGGATATLKLCYANIPISANFGGSASTYTTTSTLLQSIVLPTSPSTAWTFEYNDYDPGDTPCTTSTPSSGCVNYGSLTKVTFPSGAILSWTYASIVTNSSDVYPYSTAAYRAVHSRTLDANDGSGPHTWSYRSGSPAGAVVVTNPLGNDVVHTFTGFGCSFYETQTQWYNGSYSAGTLLKTVNTDYATYVDPYVQYGGTCEPVFAVPSRTTTTWPDGRISKIETDHDSGFTYDGGADIGTYGEVTARREYDYGNGSPGALIRQTLTSYVAAGNAGYTAANLIDLPSWVTVEDGGGQQVASTHYVYDAATPDSSGITTQHDASPPDGSDRGNATSVSRWLSTSNSWLTTNTAWFDTGMPHTVTDPAQHWTTYSYSSTYAGAYVTQTQHMDTNSPNLAHHSISGAYDFNTGLLTSFTDENGNVTNYSWDNLLRLSRVDYPATQAGSGWVSFTYTDAPNALQVERQQAINSSTAADLRVYFDDLGREVSRGAANGEATPWDRTDTCYDAIGEKSFSSYPYQASSLSSSPNCSGTGDSFAYDGLGRIARVTHSDGSSISTSYAGGATEVSDEGNGHTNVSRVSQTDGLGRLISVCEVSGATLAVGLTSAPAACGQDIGATGFLTTYGYDTLGNLTSVSQGGLNPRSFTYDSLSRLTQASNPESGTVNYTYNADSLVATRTDARGIATTYAYDELHRLRSKSYSDGTATATYNYDEASADGVGLADTIGRKSSESAGSTGAVFSYDALGRVIDNSQCTPHNCGSGMFSITYQYDLAGDPIQGTNGQGVAIGWSWNAARRITAVTSSMADSQHPGTLFSNGHYGPFGLVSATLGNGVGESRGYATRGWLNSIQAGSLWNVNIGYDNDGDVASANDTVNGNWSYAYDDFNRLASSSCTANCPDGQGTQGFSYVYDRFGNRWQQNLTSGSGPAPGYSFDANNRISSGSYDASGDLLNDGSHSYSYDAEGRVTAVDGGATASYMYDAEGRRVRRTVGSSVHDLLYDLAGHPMTEMEFDAGGNGWSRGEVYAGGRHVATYADSTTYFDHDDWLGTERARSRINGSLYETCVSLAFGDGLNCTFPNGAGTDSPVHFTGKPRDPETGLDDFGARYNSSTMGRFMTPDQGEMNASVLSDPQRWNRYLYVIDNPLTRIDPDGLKDILVFIFRQIETARSTIGTLRMVTPSQVLNGVTLELPWRNNRENVSRIPAGVYKSTHVYRLAQRDKSGRVVHAALRLNEVPGRSNVFVHGGSNPHDTEGCVLVGEQRAPTPDRIHGSPDMLNSMQKAIEETAQSDTKNHDSTKILTIVMDPVELEDVNDQATSLCAPGSTSGACQDAAINTRAHARQPQK